MYILSWRTTREDGPRAEEELESPSAGTGLKTPDSSVPRTRGYGRQRRTTANGFLTAGVDSSQGEKIFRHRRKAWTRELVQKHENLWTSQTTKHVPTLAGTATTPAKRGHKTLAKRTSSSTPVEKERRPALERGCNSTFFFWGELGGSLLCFCVLFPSAALCVSVFPKLFFFPGDHFSAKLKDMRGDADQVADVRNRRASIFSPTTLLKMARTNNTRFGRSANALG